MKKLPVLTESTCVFMEMLRTALEVQIGQRVKFFRLDMNSGHAEIFAGDQDHKVNYYFGSSDRIHFELDGIWFCGVYDSADFVKIWCESLIHVRKTVAGDVSMRWVGSSHTDRREEPLFPEKAEYCAKVRGITLEQLLNSSSIEDQLVRTGL
jgi:hypothetical protein